MGSIWLVNLLMFGINEFLDLIKLRNKNFYFLPSKSDGGNNPGVIQK